VDKIDRKLLNLLQEDASRTNARLAEEVGLSPSSCLRRIRRLTSAGIIDRIVAILNPAKADRRMKAIVTVELARHGEQQTRRFLALAAEERAVIQAYSVSGQTDVVLMLRLADMAEFDALCERLFREGRNVARYYTMFVIRTAKESTDPALETQNCDCSTATLPVAAAGDRHLTIQHRPIGAPRVTAALASNPTPLLWIGRACNARPERNEPAHDTTESPNQEKRDWLDMSRRRLQSLIETDRPVVPVPNPADILDKIEDDRRYAPYHCRPIDSKLPDPFQQIVKGHSDHNDIGSRGEENGCTEG
jgi:Lrp/AsnC family transcriptional regulator, leucine-responsive regulatory protein